MDELYSHPRIIIEILVAYWLFSAIVASMPDPPSESFWYKWIYGALHLFAGNMKTFADSKLKSLETTTETHTVEVKETKKP